jgi:Uma2 family endonuclease
MTHMTTPDTTHTISTVTPASNVPGPPQGAWTYADYARLPDNSHHYEIIDGVLYMTPSPGAAHQSAISLFVFYLVQHVQFAGLGRVFTAPFDVELGPHDTTQPDIIVVLNANLGIVTDRRIVGTPDLIVEISSPGTAAYDRGEKQATYQRAGVAEYWVADPASRTIEVLFLGAGGYQSQGVRHGAQTLPSRTVPRLPVLVEQFFA